MILSARSPIPIDEYEQTNFEQLRSQLTEQREQQKNQVKTKKVLSKTIDLRPKSEIAFLPKKPDTRKSQHYKVHKMLDSPDMHPSESDKRRQRCGCCDFSKGHSVLDSLVVHPDSDFYLSFVSFMSFISLLSTFSYSYFIGFGSDSNILLLLIIIAEISYFCSLVIESLKAYDDEGDGTYEFRWQKTTVRYWKTAQFKISLIIFIPFGLMG